jgi:hypothetical protein
MHEIFTIDTLRQKYYIDNCCSKEDSGVYGNSDCSFPYLNKLIIITFFRL